MSAARFLGRLRERGIELRADGDKLLVNAPKGAVTEEIGDEIRRRKAELLGFLRMGAGEVAAGKAADRIEPAQLVEVDGHRLAPASAGQRRLFYLDQLEPGLAVYNVPVAFHLEGALDVAGLERSIAAIVERHAVLRTTLRLEPEGLMQRIAPSQKVELERIDLSGADGEARCAQLMEERARRPFDLSAGPLFGATLFTLQTERHVLLILAHHVVTDGWSQDVFESELLAHYEQETLGKAPLAALPIQYADYALWADQTKAAGDPERDKRIDFWRTTLRAPLPLLELPTANSRPQIAPTAGETCALRLPADLVEPLAAIGRRDGATLFMVLLAGYATLLRRISGQEEVVIGTPIANRTRAETMDLIGYFANTLALRIDMTGSPSFRELLRRVRDVCTGAYANQDIPFEELVELLEVERDLSRAPIFQTIFAFEDAMPTPARAQAEGPKPLRVIKRETIHAKVARTDLSVWVSASADGLLVTAEYPTALFDMQSIGRLLDHLRVLLRAVADGADGPIDQLPILSPEDRRKILVDWNATQRALPNVGGAHQLFERRADKAPDRPAVVFGDTVLRYGELEQRANRLAHQLAASGVKPGDLVGVFLERSPSMVLTLLAVHKAGGTYVPIDPEYPADRVALMIEDSGLRLVVTTSSLIDRLPGEAKRVLLDHDAPEIEARPTTRPSSSLFASTPSEAPAYVIYTSGSTGRPKGVVVPHRALINFLASMAEKPGMSAQDTLLAVTTLSFDIAGLEMFLPLTVGAKIVIASAEQAADGEVLRKLVEDANISFMQATPSTWRLLIGAGWRGPRTDDATFKVLCGGEAFPPDLAAQLLDRATSVWNMYGPTETTIWSTCVELSKSDPRMTIGRPIDNTSIYILDPLGQPVPIGVPGELTIGGVGVAHGYLNRPELTDSRFVHDPYWHLSSGDSPGARMYKTGDLAAFRADGNVVYHRRLDHQVKVRGHRIELGEIETVLGEHEAVRECVVVVREDRPGDVRLVAYFVPREAQTVTASDLRKHLRKRLPEYMIPQHLVELPVLPLTPAGKINRKDLPAPAGAIPVAAARAPSSPAELRLAKVWADVLGSAPTLSATDNFFEVGGHSLLSMAVIARLQKETGIRINPRDLLLSSLEQIAAKIEPQLAPAAPDVRPPPEAAPPSVNRPRAPEPPPSSQSGLARSLVSRLKGKLFG